MAVFGRSQMPSFAGVTEWLNSGPLGQAELAGHAVLVDFWTLTCINWLRTEPYVRAWSRAYRDDGLIVVGVHTPEFTFEHDVDRVRRAIVEREIDYPVAVDNDYAVWRAFNNNYWPALYFIDPAGTIRDEYFGEGRYAQSEQMIQDLLGISRPPLSVQGVGVEAEADWGNLRSPETYLGYTRGDNFASPGGAMIDRAHGYQVPPRLHLNQWALTGEWTIGEEKIALSQPGGTVAFRFHARDADLVLSPGAHESIPFQLRLDGAAPGPSHGLDTDAAGNGLLDDGRFYQLIRQSGDIQDRTLEIQFLEPGAEAYVFTFG